MAFQHAGFQGLEKQQLQKEKIFSEDDLRRAIGEDFESGIENLAGRTGIARDRLIEILANCFVLRYARVQGAEKLQLFRKKIFSEDDLWRAIGEDFEKGIDNLADKTGIARDRLIAILVDCATREPDPTQSSRLAWPARHALDLLVLFFVLLLTVLSLRAGGWLSRWPVPWGLTEKIPVAAKDLQKDQVVRTGDFVEAWLNPQPDQFRNPRDIVGFRLATDLSVGSPIRFADVLREQVIALRDLPRGSSVPAGAVAHRWSTYLPDAILDPRQVIGRWALSPIRKGEVITMDQVGP